MNASWISAVVLGVSLLVLGPGKGFLIDPAQAQAPAQPSPKAPAKLEQQELHIRVLWLVSGLAQKEAPDVPAEFKDVVTELGPLGIPRPRLAAQTLIRAAPNTSFQLAGEVLLD